jgi:hypothetical protein
LSRLKDFAAWEEKSHVCLPIPPAGGNLEWPMSGTLQQLLRMPNDKGVWACGFCC